MDAKKRERSANFNNAEVQLLVSLVERHKHIIENKKTDAVTNKDKELALKKIEVSFNSCGISTIERSWKTLKLKYESVKKATKKKSSVQRQELYRTGGGPSSAPDFTHVENMVVNMCSNIKGLEARHDSDTVPSVQISINDMIVMEVDDSITVNAEVPDSAEDTARDISINISDMNESFTDNQLNERNVNVNEDEKENKWDKWQPKALKTKVSKALKTDANKVSVTSKLDKLSTARLELVNIQMETAIREKQHREEEHKLKMEHMINDEKRKQEIHALLLQKLNCAPDANDIILIFF